jgi:transposase
MIVKPAYQIDLVMPHFRPINRNTDQFATLAMNDHLPKHRLALFVVETVGQLDLKEIEDSYGTGGSVAYHPSVMFCILIFGYATGTFSSRKLEYATHDSVSFQYVAANERPDHDTINQFRLRFLNEFKSLMIKVLMIANIMKMLNLFNLAADGTKLHANASRHSALSYGHIDKLEVKLTGEVEKLMVLAEESNREIVPKGMNVAKEIALRKDQLATMAAAKTVLEQRAAVRYEQECAEHAEKLALREAKAKESGESPRGKEPKAPVEGARDKDQINLTDAESRIMKTPGGGFDQCYNGQISVDMDSMLIVTADVVQACNDKQQIEPILQHIKELPDELGKAGNLAADTGYFSERNAIACAAEGIVPLIAEKRESHHPDPLERFEEPPPLKQDATVLETMRHLLKTMTGKGLYAKRKSTVEPVFGIIKAIMGFRQFSLRGLEKVRGEFNLVALAWNIKRMAVLRQNFA